MKFVESFRPRPAPRGEGKFWPVWAQVLLSLVLLYHMAAVVVAALAAQPSSEVQRQPLKYFKNYYDFTNQGYGYRYYAKLDMTADPDHPRPWATPVVTAEMEFEGPGGGRRPRWSGSPLASSGPGPACGFSASSTSPTT